MAENPRPPVAIRIVRPFETEDALLETELDTIGKTSVVLIGAHPRPTGVILRFEMTLTTGAIVLRGEGRVLAHKENAFRGQSGLTLRFTRLDPKSKAIVDRATAMREARGGTASITTEAVPEAGRAASGSSPIAQALSAPTPAPGPIAAAADQEAAVATARAAAREKANATARSNARRTSRPPGLTPPPSPLLVKERAPEPVAEATASSGPPLPDAPASDPTMVQSAFEAPPPAIAQHQRVAPPVADFDETNDESTALPEPTPVTSIPGVVAPMPTMERVGAAAERVAPPAERVVATASRDRDALLARLRERADNLAPERVTAILEEGAARHG